MFYDNENYTILDEKRGEGESQAFHLTIWCDEPKRCPLCHTKTRKNGVPKQRTFHDYNEEKDRVEIITLKRQRYICSNSECRHTYISGISLSNEAHTKRFEEFLSKNVCSSDISFNNYAKKYETKRQTIEPIVQNYVKDLLLQFAPPSGNYAFFLKPFMYQEKKRYYLTSVDRLGNYELLSFFGYNDVKQELDDYFRFHWRNDEFPFKHIVLFTDMDSELIRELEKHFYFLHVAIIPEIFKGELKKYNIDNDSTPYFLKKDALQALREIIYPEQDTVDYVKGNAKSASSKNSKKTITFDEWWNNLSEDVKKSLFEFWEKIQPFEEAILDSVLYSHVNFKEIDSDICKHHSKRVPFEIMVARVIYSYYHEYIFSKVDDPSLFYRPKYDNIEPFKEPEMFYDENYMQIVKRLNYDEKTGIQYRLIPPHPQGNTGGKMESFELISPYDFINDIPKLDEEIIEILTNLPF